MNADDKFDSWKETQKLSEGKKEWFQKSEKRY
jgi:hypothetical protein